MEEKSDNIGQKALKAGIWYTVSSICIKGISIITTPIYTRILSTSDYGIVATFTSWYSLISIFCVLSLTYSIGRAKLDYQGRLKEYIGSMQVLSAIVTTVIILSMLIFISPLSGWMELSPVLMVILAVYLFFSPAVSFAQNGYRYEYKYKQNIIISVFTSVSTVFFSFAFIALFRDARYVGRCLGIALPMVILGVIYWCSNIKNRTIGINKEFWKYGLRLSLPLVIHTISLNILSQSDRLLITKYCGSSYTGIYSLAYSYALLINLVIGAANEAWLPWFHDIYYIKKYDDIKKNVKPFIVLECVFGLGCISLAPEAIAVLGGKSYSEGVYAVPPIVLGVICQYVYTHYVNVQMTLKRTGYVSIGTAFAAALNIVLNIIFIPKYGFVAAAYTTLAGYVTLMLLHYLINKFIMKSDIYDNKFMFGAVLLTGAGACVFSLLFKTVILRYCVIAIMCFFYLFFNRNFLKEITSRFTRK